MATTSLLSNPPGGAEDAAIMQEIERLMRAAKDAVDAGRYDEAMSKYKEALRHDSGRPDIHYGLGCVYFMVSDNLNAVGQFMETIRLDPQRAGAFINLGAAYNRMGRPQEAIDALNRSILLDPRPEAYYNIALAYRQIGQVESAIESYRKALALRPDMYDALFNLGNIYLEQEKFVDAISSYELALIERPNWPKGQAALENARQLLKDTTDERASTSINRTEDEIEDYSEFAVPDFFQEQDGAAIRRQVEWLEANLGMTPTFFAEFLSCDVMTFDQWKIGRGDLGNKLQSLLELWGMITHLLSFLNFDTTQMKRFLDNPVSAPSELGASPMTPPWAGTCLKSFLEINGAKKISSVERWITAFRFGNPYAA